jgi:hypothetical protein
MGQAKNTELHRNIHYTIAQSVQTGSKDMGKIV